MAPKSIWRQPNAVHFQVVHRSQRDVMRNDADASEHVLKPIEHRNRSKGKSRAELAQELPDAAGGAPARANVGEAALYGVYYDDTDYDYMQHLRVINDSENSKRGGVDEDDDTEAVWIPSAVQPKDRAPKFALREDAAKDTGAAPKLMLPSSVFASEETPMEHLYDEPLHGLQPDMDPHLRQTLEALDDDAFVDDDLDDDFFSTLVQDGAWNGERGADDAWRDAAPEGDTIWLTPAERALREREAAGGDEAALSLEARVALFKAQQAAQAAAGSDDEDDEDDEARDTLGALGPAAARRARPTGSVSSSGSALGKKGRPGVLARRAASVREGSVGGASTAWSMTSSSMFRNANLTELDSRFDQVIREYGGQATGDPELDALTNAFADVDMHGRDDDDDDELDEETVERLTREDLDAIMDDFLEHHEVIAGKLRPTLGDRSTTADEKLAMIRHALGEAHITDSTEDASSPAAENPFLNPSVLRADREKWDVETIQTTKTNLENHPRTIAAAESVRGSVAGKSSGMHLGPRPLADGDVRIPKIRIHPRTGMPQVVGYTVAAKDARRARPQVPQDDTQSVSASASDDEGGSDSDGDLDGDGDGDGDGDSAPRPAVAKRDRHESKEQRKARKDAQKKDKQQRKLAKATAKKAFAAERKRQTHASQRQAESRGGASGMHLS